MCRTKSEYNSMHVQRYTLPVVRPISEMKHVWLWLLTVCEVSNMISSAHAFPSVHKLIWKHTSVILSFTVSQTVTKTQRASFTWITLVVKKTKPAVCKRRVKREPESACHARLFRSLLCFNHLLTAINSCFDICRRAVRLSRKKVISESPAAAPKHTPG